MKRHQIVCLLGLGSVALNAVAADAVTNAVTPLSVSFVKIQGHVSEKMNRLFHERFMTDFARTTIYDEAVNAFKTNWDDQYAPKFGWWQGEYWGKTMLSAAEVYSYTQDEVLKSFIIEKAHAFVDAYQRSDGYIGTYKHKDFLTSTNPLPRDQWCWNIWGRKYTIWALYDIFRVTGDRKCLDAAVRTTDQLLAMLKAKGVRFAQTGSFYGIPSSSILKPLLLLYREVGNSAYLQTAKEIVSDMDRDDGSIPNLIGNAFGDRPIHEWYPEPFFWAKAYETMSFMDGLIEYHRVTGEMRPLEAVKRLHAKLLANELNPLMNVGYFDHFVDGAHRANAITEPCDATHWIRVNRELYLLTGDTAYLDLMEKTFYNAFLGAVYRDGKWGAHAVRSHGCRHRAAPSQVNMKYHQCCIDNMPRTFIDWASSQVGWRKDGSLDLNFYSDAHVKAEGVELDVQGNYPVSGRVCVKVNAESPLRMRFRVPGWSVNLLVNGNVSRGPWHEVRVPAGTSEWFLQFNMTPVVRSTYSHHAIARTEKIYGQAMDDWLTSIFESAQENPEMKGRSRSLSGASIMRGPLVLAKCLRSGETLEKIFDARTINHAGYEVLATPLECGACWGRWKLTLKCGSDVHEVRVSDFASAADTDDPANAFSIWF